MTPDFVRRKQIAATQSGSNEPCLKDMEMLEYRPGDVVPVTSSFYHVVHKAPKEGEYLQTFYRGDQFLPCPECGTNVRYLIRVTALTT